MAPEHWGKEEKQQPEVFTGSFCSQAKALIKHTSLGASQCSAPAPRADHGSRGAGRAQRGRGSPAGSAELWCCLQVWTCCGSKGLSPSRAGDKGSLGWCLGAACRDRQLYQQGWRIPMHPGAQSASGGMSCPCAPAGGGGGFPDPIPERFEMPTLPVSPCSQCLALCTGGAVP